MGQSNINLAALIGSRICHDLTNPIGAITNGLELLELSRGAMGDEVGLIADSVGNAGARIRFFRVAYGAAGEQMMSASEIEDILVGIYSRHARHTVDWTVAEGCTRVEARMVFLAIQCCETALPLGGHISVEREDGIWRLVATGRRIAADSTLWYGLTQADPTSDITPAQVQFALLPVYGDELGLRVGVTISDDLVELRF